MQQRAFSLPFAFRSAAVLVVLALLLPAQAAAGVLLGWNAPAKSRVGSSFTLRLTIASSEPVNKLALSIGYDPRTLEVLRVAAGDSGAVTFASSIDPAGKVALNAASGTALTGTVASITFRAIEAAPASPLQVLAVQAANGGGAAVDVAVPGVAPVTIQP